MLLLRALLIALVLTAAAGVSPAATFYCDPVKGSPQGDGSAENPWRTIEEVIALGRIDLRNKDGQPATSRPASAAPKVKAGDTILLRSGWHGVIRIAQGYNDDFITLAADKGHAPQVGWVEIGEGRKWRIKGLTISPSLAPSTRSSVPTSPSRPPRNLVTLGERGGEDSAELIVEDCFLYSVLDTSSWTGRDWVTQPHSGIFLGRHGARHAARNNYVLNTRFGIQLCAPDCLTEGNVVANFSADGIRATRDGNVVQYNVIKNIFAGSRDGDSNHDDGIQVFLFNVGRGTLRNMVFRGNIVIARESDNLPWPNPLQGLGFFDGPLVNFLVEKNVVCTNHYHGITLSDAQSCTIQDNVVYSRWGGRMRPWIRLGKKQNLARGNTVRNNLAHSFHFGADPEVKAENNREVAEADFKARLSELSALIDARFGRIHPVAGRPRLE